MRKLKRQLLRAEAKARGMKPSKYVKNRWNRWQVRLVGPAIRRINKAKGTAPKKVLAEPD